MFGAGGPELRASACPSIIVLIKKHSAMGANIFMFLTIWGRIISAKVLILFKLLIKVLISKKLLPAKRLITYVSY